MIQGRLRDVLSTTNLRREILLLCGSVCNEMTHGVYWCSSLRFPEIWKTGCFRERVASKRMFGNQFLVDCEHRWEYSHDVKIGALVTAK